MAGPSTYLDEPDADSSVVSSRMTDIPSEEDDNDSNAGAYGDDASTAVTARPEASSAPSARDRSVDTSQPPNSAAGTTSLRGTWGPRPPSRRSHLGVGAGHTPVSRTGTPGSIASTGTGRPHSIVSRPPSAASKTHVPSLTSHAFFRPMSSQRLQAQRAVRHQKSGQTPGSDDGFSEVGSNTNRHSYGSHSAMQRGSPALPEQEEAAPPPPSRDTEVTERDGPEPGLPSGSVTGNGTIQSLSDSVTPLQAHSANLDSALDAPRNPKPEKPPAPNAPRSAMNLRSKLRGSHGAPRGDAHQRGRAPPSTMSSPASDTTKAETRARSKLGSNFEYYTGNTTFCWGGRLQNTRDRPINIATGLFVVVPAALFLAFSGPWLWRHVSPAIPILFGYIFLICISSFLHASFSDPGILPRNLHPFPATPAHQDPLTLGPPTTTWTIIKSAHQPNGAMEVPTKYCKSCNIWRPPRAHHCRVCDCCVETQDHHCVWLNNCVGRRNYRYFFAFVSSSTLLGLFLFGASLAHVLLYRARERLSFGAAADRCRLPMAMAVYAVLATPYPAALWAYHSLLMAKAETTREYLNSHKFPKHERHRPFNQGGLLRNLVVVLGRPRPPTYLRFKDRYVDGDQRFGPTRRSHRQAPLANEADDLARHGGRGAAGAGGAGAGAMEMAHVKPAPRMGLFFSTLPSRWMPKGRAKGR